MARGDPPCRRRAEANRVMQRMFCAPRLGKVGCGRRATRDSLYYGTDSSVPFSLASAIASRSSSSVRQVTDTHPLLGKIKKSCPCNRTTRQSDETNLARRPLSATQAASDDVLIARIALGDRLAMQVLY